MGNWLVCLAIMMATAAQDFPGKVLAIIFPITTFVAIGLEHSVANLFLIPAGIIASPEVTWADFIVHNLIPVTIGNIIGGIVAFTLPFALTLGSLHPRKDYRDE